MSTVQADTLAERDGSESVPVDTVIHGSAKAWVNFNGTGTVAINGSFNVSSITDIGTGQYRANFTDPMPDTNYCVSTSSRLDSANYNGNEGISTLTTTYATIIYSSASAYADRDLICASVFG